MKKQKQTNFQVFGINSCAALLQSTKFDIDLIYVEQGNKALENSVLRKHLKNDSFPVELIPKNQFDQRFSGYRTQGIVINFSGPVINESQSFKDQNDQVCLLALDQVEDPQNVGQIIRTAECAGIDGILFPRHHSAHISNTVLQVSQGAFVHMQLYEINNLREIITQLKNDDFWIIGVENTIVAEPWTEIDYSGKILIIVGSEGKGIRKKVLENCDFLATIPMQGKINSLNVSAALSAILFERQRQLEISK